MYAYYLYYLFRSGEKDHYFLDFENDEVTRGSCVLHEGKMMWPPPPPKVVAPPPAAAAAAAVVVEKKEPNYFADTLKDSLMYTVGLGSVLGMLSCDVFLDIPLPLCVPCVNVCV